MPLAPRPGDAVRLPAPLQRWLPWVISLALFSLNGYICRELFHVDFLKNLDSNEGAFVALARFYKEHFGEQWFSWFNAGSPIENAYQPLLPALGALTSLLTGLTAVRAMHLLLALTYCFGPVSLFWFAWEWSRSIALALVASLAYSLLSPAELLIPILRVHVDGHWVPLRLYNIVHYAEDPHNLALTLLPLALLFLYRAMIQRTPLNLFGAIVLSGFVVSANAFGAIDLAVGGIAIAVSTGGGYAALAAVGAAAWLWLSPWLPPSLIALISHGQWGAAGQMTQTFLAPILAIAGFGLLVWLTRKFSTPFERFVLLFGYWLILIPLGFFHFHITLVPQGGRYQLELELAVCLLVGAAFARALKHSPTWAPCLMIAGIIVVGVRQTQQFRRAARQLIVPIDITQTIEYKNCQWLDTNFHGQRAMVAGDTAFLCNVLYDNPQLGAGHEPSAPNFHQLVALYIAYSGTPENDPHGELSTLWMKAFGTAAMVVPGPKSREFYHPIAFPRRFEGRLPVLWHEEDDTIFQIPQRSSSLARVVPQKAVMRRPPAHGLDVESLRPFVAALDDSTLPLAKMQWSGLSSAIIRTSMTPDQVISVAVNYAPGWRATNHGRRVPVTRDAIGLTVISPQCDGPCEIRLQFGLSTEGWMMRLLSAAITILLGLLLIRGIFEAVRKAPRLPQ